MAEFIPVEPFSIVIFGGTGDLSRKKLLPALYHRYLDGQVDNSTRIIAVSRTERSDNAFMTLTKEACKSATEGWNETKWTEFSKLLAYHSLDASDPNSTWPDLVTMLGGDDRPVIFYLATTPLIYVDICQSLKTHNLNDHRARVVLEKPIGTDLKSAKKINEGVSAVFAENSIFRIDHYLGKETVQNLMVLRFANPLFESIWGREWIDHVQITVAEDIGLEGRADYYDRSGALRDMVQNHLLQLLCLVAMEPPNAMEGDLVRTEKMKVLKALKPVQTETAKSNTVRGQYMTGTVGGETVHGYLETLSGENSDSKTETFVAIKTEVQNRRWAGVPFYLRTGKRMASRQSEIVIQLKMSAHSLFESADTSPNRLVLRLQPDEGVHLYMQIKEPGPGGMRFKSLPLNLSYAESFSVHYPDAYERLLMDVVRGNLSLFMRSDEVEAAWSWVDQILKVWNETDQPVWPYAAGTNGPVQAYGLISNDEREWWEGAQYER